MANSCRSHSGGRLKIIAAIEVPPVIAKMLAHLNFLARASPRSPAQALDLFSGLIPNRNRFTPTPMIPLDLHSRERVKGVQFSHLHPMYGATNPRETACAQQRLVRLTAHQAGYTVVSSKKGRLFSLYPHSG
jgi:hypothetical protein